MVVLNFIILSFTDWKIGSGTFTLKTHQQISCTISVSGVIFDEQ